MKSLRRGNRVVDRSDPRHEGRVGAAMFPGIIRVDWDTGLRSYVEARHLVRVSECAARAAEAAIERELGRRR